MELVAGYPFWLIKDGLPYQYPRLRENIKCQIVIVGGGISGAVTAYYLTNAGVECILVDGRTIALGSTCASTSLLQYELDIPLHRLKKIVGEQNAIRSYQLCGDAVEKLIAIMNAIGYKDYEKKQSLYFSRHKKEIKTLKNEFEARRQAGFDVELLMKDELKKNYGLDAACGIISEKGATTNAYLFTHEILQNCIQRGLKVYDHTKIKMVEQRKEKVILKTEDDCIVTADHVINATGYEVINFIDKKIVNLDCTYAIISEKMIENQGAWNKKTMMWNTDDPYLYLCSADDRIVVGGRDEAFVNIKTMHTYLDKKTALLEKDFKKFFPSVSFKTEFAWSGVFGKTKDSLPYIGSNSKTPGIFYALGFGGNGITFSLVAAEIITDLVLGKKNKNADIFSFNR